MKLLPEKIRERTKLMGSLKNLFSEFLEPALEFMRINCKELVTTSDGNITQSLMRIRSCYIESYKET